MKKRNLEKTETSLYTYDQRDLSFKKQEQHARTKEAIQEEIKTHLKLKYNIREISREVSYKIKLKKVYRKLNKGGESKKCKIQEKG